MTRLLLLLGLLALAAPASAQGYGDPYYGNPYDSSFEEPGVGVRVGVGVGAYVYDGPQVTIAGQPVGAYRDVVQTRPAVTAEVSFPLGSQNLRGRLVGGLLNIGADDIPGLTPGANPFLTSESILAEANLMYYLVAPGRGFAPYVFSGLGGIFATGDRAPGVNSSILAIPVGVGAEFGVSRNLALFGEASYRFGLTGVSDGVVTALAAFGPGGDCDTDPTSTDCKPCDDPTSTNPACKPCDDPTSTNPVCLPCDDPDSTDPSCPTTPGPVGPGGGDQDFGSSFNSALFTGGLRLGFAPAPRPYIPPPPPPAPPPVIPVAPVVVPPPAVCNLIELNPVYFDYGSSTISPRARALLNENVELLLANPECCVFIDGTIDNQEMDRFGMPLAGRRAQAVYDYYLGRGVTASKMQIRNRGEGSPNCDKEDPGIGCERNRRVETIPVDCDNFRALLESPVTNPY